MIWASYEFKSVVKEVHKKRLPKPVIILLILMVVCLSAFWISYFIAKNGKGCVISYAFLIAAVVCYTVIWIKWKKQNYDYVSTIRHGAVKSIRNEMDKRELPLSLFGDVIAADITSELKRIESEKARLLEFIKKAWNALIYIPCGCFITLLFPVIINAQSLSSFETLYALTGLISQTFTILLLVVLSAVALYIPIGNIIKDVTGEHELELCLDILKEIKISCTYENEPPERIRS